MAELDDQYWLEKAARVNQADESLRPDLTSLQGLNSDMGAALDGPQPAFDPLDPRLTRAPQPLAFAQPQSQGQFPFNDLPPNDAPMWTKVLAGAGGALEALSAGYHGRTPLFLQMQQQGLQKQQLAEQVAARKLQMAQHFAQLEEQKRAHNWWVTEKLLATGNPEALKEFAKSSSFPEASMIADAVAAKDLADIPALVHGGYIPKEFMDRMINPQPGQPKPTVSEIRAYAQFGLDQRKQDMKIKLEQQAYDMAVQTPPEQRRPSQTSLIEERAAKLDVEKARAESLYATANAKENQTPKVTQMAEEISQELFDKPWEHLSQHERAQVSAEKEKRIQGRTAAVLTNTQLPESSKNQADMYTQKGLDNLELEQAPPGLTPAQYRTGPYRQLDEKEKDALVQYKVAEKTISTMTKVANHLITATSPGAALKQKIALELGAATGKNGLAAAYKADKASFSSRMARLVEVGVLTNTDVTRWEDTFGAFGDTVQTLKAKQALFGEIQDETARLLKLRLGGKIISNQERSKLDKLMDKTDTYRSVDQDFNTLMGTK